MTFEMMDRVGGPNFEKKQICSALTQFFFLDVYMSTQGSVTSHGKVRSLCPSASF